MAEINAGENFTNAYSKAQNNTYLNRVQDNEEANQLQVQIQNQIKQTLQWASDTVKAATDAGKDPAQVAGVVQPLIETAAKLAAGPGGKDVASAQRIMQIGQSLLTRPAKAATPEGEYKAVKTGSDEFGDQYSLLHSGTGEIRPIDKPGAATNRTALSQPPVSSAPSVNLTGDGNTVTGMSIDGQPTAPVAPPAQVASTGAAPAPSAPQPATPPIATVAQRFDAVNPAPDTSTPFDLSMAAKSNVAFPDGVEPGADAVDYAINNKIFGEEFLKALPPTARNKVTDVANYKIPLDAISKRKDQQATVASWVHQYTNGAYDAKWYKPMQNVIKEFTSGTANSSPAQAMVVGNTAIQHLGTMSDAVDAMAQVPGLLAKIAKSEKPFVSYAANALKNESIKGTSEGMALQSFLTARQRYVDEITKFYGGAQGGSEGDRERSIKTLDAAIGLPSLYSAMNTETHLLDSKVNAIQDRWKTGQLGPKFADTALRVTVPDFPVIQSKSKTAEEAIAKKYIAIRFTGQNPSNLGGPASSGGLPPPPPGFNLD